MAIAPLYAPACEEWAEEATPELPWPKPVLRLLASQWDPGDPDEPEAPPAARLPTGTAPCILESRPALPADLPWEDGMELSTAWSMAVASRSAVVARRRGRAARIRRRRLSLLVAAGVLIGLLALPLGALGGRTVSGAASPSRPAPGTVYTVQPGDTLWSIASHLEPGTDPRALVAHLAATIGSTTVFPGEQIHLPASGG
jgi:LysM domain